MHTLIFKTARKYALNSERKIDHTSKTTMPSLVEHVHAFAALLTLPDLVLVCCLSQNGLCVETKEFGGSVQGVVTMV